MKGKVNCTCGWSWNKSDSSAKDMYICHECGRDNSNNMQNGGDIPQAQDEEVVYTPPKSQYKRLYGHATDYSQGENPKLRIDPNTGYGYFPPELSTVQQKEVPDSPWNVSRFLFDPLIMNASQGIHNAKYDKEGKMIDLPGDAAEEGYLTTGMSRREKYNAAKKDITSYYKEDLKQNDADVEKNVDDTMDLIRKMRRTEEMMQRHNASYTDFQNPEEVFRSAVGFNELSPIDSMMEDKNLSPAQAKRAYKMFQKTWRGTSGKEARQNSREELKKAQEAFELAKEQMKEDLPQPDPNYVPEDFANGGILKNGGWLDNIPQAQEGIKSPNVWAQEQHFQQKKKQDEEYEKLIGNAGEEAIDIAQRFTPWKYLPGLGSTFAVGEAEVNNQDPALSDELGMIPFWPAQAASLMLLYAEKEAENFKKFAENRDRGKTYAELAEEKKIEENLNPKVINNTYVPKPKVIELKETKKKTKKETKSKKVPYTEKKEINKVEIDNTRTVKPQVNNNYKPESKPETKYKFKFNIPSITYSDKSFVMPREVNDTKIDNTYVAKPRRKNGGWLDNYNDSQASAPEGMIGDGYSNVGRNYSPAWGGQFQDGGNVSDEDYNMKRALELGYTADESGHWPSVDYETGEWLKSKKHHTRGMEMMAYELNPELRSKYNLIENEKGKLQYVPKLQKIEEYQMGGNVYPVNYVPQAQNGKRLNPFTYTQPDHYSMNPFLVRDLQHGIFVGGINPTYSTKDFSIGASAVGVGNKDFIKPIADYGIKGSYNPTDNLSINANISKENVGAGVSYRFQSGGSIPGSVGFTYARTKGIPSNGPYAKKTMASAQTGIKLDFSKGPTGKMKESLEEAKQKNKKKNIKEQNITEKDNLKINIPIQKEQTKKQKIKSSINDQSRFMKDWMNSPMYDKMVDNSTTGYFDKQYLNSGRNSNFNNTGVQLQPQPKLSPNTGADSNNQTGLIRLFPLGTQSDALEGMVAHEYSHSSDRPMNWQTAWLDKFKPVNKYDNDKLGLGDEEEVRLIPEKDINLMKLFYSDNKSYKNLFNKSALKDKDLNEDREWFNYVSEPTETRARLNDIRYNAKKYNIYDPFTQKVTPKILNKIKELTKKAGGFDPFNQLQGVYSDDEILHLLNNISQNEQPDQNPNIATAQNGVVFDKNGKRVFPNIKKDLQMLNDIVKNKKGEIKSADRKTNFPLIKIKDEREEAFTKVDNTRTASKPKVTDVKKLNVKNKTEAEIAEIKRKNDEAIAAQRKAVREKADASPLNNIIDKGGAFNPSNWSREELENATAGLESKFRVSDEPNVFDDYINPASWVGRMSANLGAAPNQIVQQDSMMPLVSSIAEPVLGGAIGEVVGPYISKGLNAMKRPLAKAAVPVLEGLNNVYNNVYNKTYNISSLLENKAFDLASSYRANNKNIMQKAIEAANAGNAWTREWYSNPEIQARYNEWITPANKFIDPKTALFYSNIDDAVSGLSNINLDKSVGNKLAGTVARNNLEKLLVEGKFTNPVTHGLGSRGTLGRFSHGLNDALINIAHPGFNKRIFGKGYDIANTFVHENTHAITKGNYGFKPEFLKRFTEPFARTAEEIAGKQLTKHQKYLTKATEVHARINELRRTFGLSPETVVDDNMINNIINQGLKGKTSVEKDFFKLIKDKVKFKELMNTAPAIGVGVGLGAGALQQKKEGGIIDSDRGQWDHPGEITRISGGNITMKRDPKTGKALTEPILGIADTGEEQWMYPGEDYNFEGANYVTEYPKGKKPRMAKNGLRQEQKGLVNLDQLTNFTNYNKPQPGGWLSKYE